MSQGTTPSTKSHSSPASPAPSCDMSPTADFAQYLREYARAKPDIAALWCFGIGFVIGWKLKPW